MQAEQQSEIQALEYDKTTIADAIEDEKEFEKESKDKIDEALDDSESNRLHGLRAGLNEVCLTVSVRLTVSSLLLCSHNVVRRLGLGICPSSTSHSLTHSLTHYHLYLLL